MHQNYSHHLWLQIAPVCLFITGWGNAYWCSRFLEPAFERLFLTQKPMYVQSIKSLKKNYTYQTDTIKNWFKM
jgi:hypothetical protein